MKGSLGNAYSNCIFFELCIKVCLEGKRIKDIGKLSYMIAKMNAPPPTHVC